MSRQQTSLPMQNNNLTDSQLDFIEKCINEYIAKQATSSGQTAANMPFVSKNNYNWLLFMFNNSESDPVSSKSLYTPTAFYLNESEAVSDMVYFVNSVRQMVGQHGSPLEDKCFKGFATPDQTKLTRNNHKYYKDGDYKKNPCTGYIIRITPEQIKKLKLYIHSNRSINTAITQIPTLDSQTTLTTTAATAPNTGKANSPSLSNYLWELPSPAAVSQEETLRISDIDKQQTSSTNNKRKKASPAAVSQEETLRISDINTQQTSSTKKRKIAEKEPCSTNTKRKKASPASVSHPTTANPNEGMPFTPFGT